MDIQSKKKRKRRASTKTKKPTLKKSQSELEDKTDNKMDENTDDYNGTMGTNLCLHNPRTKPGKYKAPDVMKHYFHPDLPDFTQDHVFRFGAGRKSLSVNAKKIKVTAEDFNFLVRKIFVEEKTDEWIQTHMGWSEKEYRHIIKYKCKMQWSHWMCNAEESPPYKCLICDTDFQKFRSLSSHLKYGNKCAKYGNVRYQDKEEYGRNENNELQIPAMEVMYHTQWGKTPIYNLPYRMGWVDITTEQLNKAAGLMVKGVSAAKISQQIGLKYQGYAHEINKKCGLNIGRWMIGKQIDGPYSCRICDKEYEQWNLFAAHAVLCFNQNNCITTPTKAITPTKLVFLQKTSSNETPNEYSIVKKPNAHIAENLIVNLMIYPLFWRVFKTRKNFPLTNKSGTRILPKKEYNQLSWEPDLCAQIGELHEEPVDLTAQIQDSNHDSNFQQKKDCQDPIDHSMTRGGYTIVLMLRCWSYTTEDMKRISSIFKLMRKVRGTVNTSGNIGGINWEEWNNTGSIVAYYLMNFINQTKDEFKFNNIKWGRNKVHIIKIGYNTNSCCYYQLPKSTIKVGHNYQKRKDFIQYLKDTNQYYDFQQLVGIKDNKTRYKDWEKHARENSFTI